MSKYKVGLGVTGGIACYKAVEIMRLLQRSGCSVSVAMTRHATEFVRPLTFRALTDQPVIVDDYDPQNPDPIAHVNFSQNIDLLLIAPATANTIAKFANGIADDFLTSTYLASTAPVLIAPAMNTAMWESPATQRNVERLRADGVYFVEPVAGELACKTIGTGKLEDVENIVEQALRFLTAETPRRRGPETGKPAEAIPSAAHTQDLAGEKFLITVGGTREAIDPVRFISNHSSGKMGFALAEAAAARGAQVTVVAGTTSAKPPDGIEMVRAMSAQHMFDTVRKHLDQATVFVGAAAVADYAPAAAEGKIKKDGRDFMILELKRTPDILAEVAKDRSDGLLVAGFAAETHDVLGYAREKLKKKDLDLVIANDVTRAGAGFNTDTNIATIITKSGSEIDLPLMSKRDMADKILDEILNIRRGAAAANIGGEPVKAKRSRKDTSKKAGDAPPESIVP